MNWHQTIPPAVDPLDLGELKAHCRIVDAEEDNLLLIYLRAAVRLVEEEIRRQLISATWTLYRPSWGCLSPFSPYRVGGDGRALRLPHGRLQSVTSVKYVDLDGTLQTLAADQYQVCVSEEPGIVLPAYGTSWPEARGVPDAVRIAYVVGYGPAPSDVPEAIRAAVLLLAADLYESREANVTGTIVAANPTLDRLLSPYRMRDPLP